MPDYGQKATDAEFRRLRAKINDVYRQAYKEIEQKGREFAQAHARREAQLRQMVTDGKMTQADFDAWMRGQVFQGEQWQKKKQQMADTLYHADQVAQQMVNDSRYNVFAANANYMGYSLEHDAGIKTNFGLYDADSVRRLVKKEPDLLPPKKMVGKDKSYQWYNKQVQSAITQGIVQGESLDKIAHRIGKQTGETSMTAMLRNARTMQTGAQNAGRIEGLHQAQELGIKVKKQWMATLDSHTRDAHADLDGQIADVDEPFDSELGPIMYPGDPDADPANVWNCFIGQTKVASDSEIIRSYKHDYNGELFIIKTARGVEFTCTPNHPILTPHGWIGANRLHEGDNILIAGIGDGDTLGIDPDVDHVFPRLDALHELFNKTFSERAAGLSVDFHGDRATANVEVVSKERLLVDDGNASGGEMGDKLQLKHSASLVLAKRHLVPSFRRVHVTALRLVRRAGKSLSFFGAGLSHAIKHGFRTVPRGDTAILEPKRDGMSGNVQFLGQGLDRFPGKILVDDIVNINITTVSHIPVFNLQTRNGYYFVNDIIAQNREKCNGYFAIAHNCRCTLVYVYPEYPNSMERRDNETGENVGDMTYREWEEMKRGEGDEPEPEKHEMTTQEAIDDYDRRLNEIDESIKNTESEYQDLMCQQMMAFGTPEYDELTQQLEAMDKKFAESYAEADRLREEKREYLTQGAGDEIKRIFGEINGPHSMEDDLWATNRITADDSRSYNNCGYCTLAFDARRRGIDCKAPYIFGANDRQLSGWWKDFSFETTGQYYPQDAARTIKETAEGWGPGARGVVAIDHNEGMGHYISFEVGSDGVCRFVDAQSGVSDASEAFDSASPGGVRFGRTDDKELTKSASVYIEKGGWGSDKYS